MPKFETGFPIYSWRGEGGGGAVGGGGGEYSV